MSPSSSIPSQPNEIARKTVQSGRSSAALAVPSAEAILGKQPSPIATTSPTIHYTCFIRLPFSRPQNFSDPPPVEWDSVKDKALWRLVSKASNSRDLDWEAIAAKFEVDLPFLLQQAAWLYERHFEGMKKQMQKLGVSAVPSSAPSPAPPESASASGTTVGGVSMQRTGSKDSRMPSVITARRDLPSAGGDSGSSPGTPRLMHPPISRTPSTTTVTQSKMLASGGKQPLQRAFRSSSGSQRRPPPLQKPAELSQGNDDDESALGHDGQSDSTDSEEEPSAMARSQAFRRAPLAKPKPPMRTVSSDGDAEDDEDDEDLGGYLPFAATATKPSAKDDPTATVHSSPKRQQSASTQPPAASKGKQAAEHPPSSSASSASSAQHPPASSESNASSSQQRPGPISPRHRARLASLSPRYSRKDGSEGSPSMGSSFSDLDDASVTQSALEEALLSMQHGSAMGSMASRMSSLRDALGRRQ